MTMQQILTIGAVLLAMAGAAYAQPAPVTPSSVITSNGPMISVTPTVTVSSTYSAGNQVGQLMQFSGAVANPTYSGILESVTMTVKTAQTGEFDLYLCTSYPSTSGPWTDKTAPAINQADVAKCSIGPLKLTTTGSGLGTHTVYNLTGIATVFQLQGPGVGVGAPNALYGILITPAQPSAQFGSTSDITINLGILQ